MSLDRQTLLQVIRHHRASALDDLDENMSSHHEAAEAPRWDDSFNRVREVLQSLDPSMPSGEKTEWAPVPLEVVSAFLDGTLPSEEAQQVCQRALLDDDFLRELIVLVEAETIPPSVSLKDDLRDRLMQIPVDASQPGTIQPQSTSTIPTRPNASVQVSPVTRETHDVARVSMGWVLSLVASAAGILAVSWWWSEGQVEGPSPAEIANSSTPTITPDELRVAPTPSALENEKLAESTNPNLNRIPEPTPDLLDPERKDSQRQTDLVQDDLDGAKDVRIVQEDSEAIDLAVPAPNQTKDALAEGSTKNPATDTNRGLGTARWQEITGLFVRSELPVELMDTRDTSAELRSQTATAITANQSTNLSNGMKLQTLPLSRAEASLDKGGRMVLAADTSVHVLASGNLDLHSGSVALVDLPADSQLVLNGMGPNPHVMNVLQDSRWVLRRNGRDVWVDVYEGGVEVDGQLVKKASKLVSNRGNRPIGSEPILPRSRANMDLDRQPRWIDRPIDKIRVPRTFLAQLGDSGDVSRTLQDQLVLLSKGTGAGGTSRDKLALMMTLANWRASLDERQLFRLAASDRAVLRQAALGRLTELLPGDPRHAIAWRTWNQDVAQQTNVQPIRSGFVSVWRSRAMNRTLTFTPNQTNDLIGVLQTGGMASRSASDYLLRLAYQGGPRFDPTWTGTTLSRGVAAWRNWVRGKTGANSAASRATRNP